MNTDSGGDGLIHQSFRICYYDSAQTLYYSDSITIDQSSGAVSLSDPQAFEFSCGNYTLAMESCAALAALGPCYITNCYGDPDAIYYLPAGATYTSGSNAATSTFTYSHSDGDYYAYWNNHSDTKKPAYLVESQIYNIPAGETTYVHSTDRSAYPDGGTVDGLTYQYLGIPFDNAVTAPKIAVGSYVGTGTYGADNPTSLTFDFVPKLVVISDEPTYNPDVLLLINGMEKTSILTKSSSGWALAVTWSGNTVQWYAKDSTKSTN